MSADEGRALLVASNPLIISSVMKNLPAKQLNKCAQVCRLWRDIADSEKKRRNRICWFFKANCDKEGAHRSLSCTYECEKRYLSPFQENLANLPFQPVLTLGFCTQAMMDQWKLFRSLGERIRKRKHDASKSGSDIDSLRLLVANSLLPHFPASCQIGLCFSYGVTDYRNTRDMKFCPTIAAIFFPRMPGVEVYNFVTTDVLQSNSSKEIVDITGIPPDQSVKCLLFFQHYQEECFHDSPAFRIACHYGHVQGGEIAIGGTSVRHTCFPQHKVMISSNSYGIAFTGNKIRAASLVIEIDYHRPEKIAENLQLFGQSGLLSGQCIVFMFSYLDHNKDSPYKADLQSDIFRRMYPSVPLFIISDDTRFARRYVPGLLKEKIIIDCLTSAVYVLLSFET